MFRPMRRFKQQISQEECVRILCEDGRRKNLFSRCKNRA